MWEDIKQCLQCITSLWTEPHSIRSGHVFQKFLSCVRKNVYSWNRHEGPYAQGASHLSETSLIIFADHRATETQNQLLADGGIERLPGGGGQCLVCGRAFSGLRNAKRHYHTVHLQENSPCRCPVCNKTFLRKELMKDHLRRKHKMYKDMYRHLVHGHPLIPSRLVQPILPTEPLPVEPTTIKIEDGAVSIMPCHRSMKKSWECS